MEEEIFYKGYKIKVRQNHDFVSPDDWGDENLFLVNNNRNFHIKREGFDPEDLYEDGDENYWLFPVESYIHSIISLSLFTGTKQCRWDSSVSGYILASKDEFKTEEDAKIAAENLIVTWNQYLSGEVYGYIIEKLNIIYSISKEKFDKLLFENDLSNLEKEFDTEDEWEYIDSCWDFYGDPHKSGLIDEAKNVIDSLN